MGEFNSDNSDPITADESILPQEGGNNKKNTKKVKSLDSAEQENFLSNIPEFKKKNANSVSEYIANFSEILNTILVEKERLRLEALDNKAYIAFQAGWVSDSNKLYKSLANLKSRRLKLQINEIEES